MTRPSLLAILCCPETRKPLRIAETSIIEGVNKRIKSGDCKNRGGEAVSEVLTEALLTEDGSIVYPVRNHIPILLVSEGIEL